MPALRTCADARRHGLEALAVDPIQRERQVPPMQREAGVEISRVAGRWWLLHTKSRSEKATAWELLDARIDFFLPLMRVSRQYGRHRQEVVLPLFAGYMFCACATDEQRAALGGLKRLASIVNVADQEKLKQELEQVRRALETPHQIDLFPGIRKGRRCRVLSGSLKGLEGVVIMRRDQCRLYLDVSILGQSAVVEIDAIVVEPID